MPTHLKDLVHARMEKTGESYQQALRHVRAEQEQCNPVGLVEQRDERLVRSRSVADTAFSIAVVRAEEKERAPRLFEDPYAHLFASAGEHAAESTQRFLELPFFRDGVRLRTRFIDDAVRDGLAAGLDQVVLLGAGFDMRGLRMREISERRARVFEVDTAEQLARKKQVLATGRIKIPANVAYVPFDFDAADFSAALSAALEARGFRKGAGAIFVWEGVIGYIGNDEMDESLRFMADEGGPRSRVVFTFAEHTFEPETAAEHTGRLGFSSCESVASDELWRRYLPGDPHPNAFVIKIGIAIV